MEKNVYPVIHEVGMRDGLQIEKQTLPKDKKIKWIETLIDCGVDIIQIGSFVRADKLPQMADTDELFKHFSKNGKKNKNTILSGLVLNEKGLDRALDSNVEMICMGVSASETYSKKNTGMTTDEALRQIIPMVKKSISFGRRVQVSVQNAFGCSYEGQIAQEKVIDIVKKYLDAGATIISIADSSGMANPSHVESLFEHVLNLSSGVEYACHFHETYGLGLANVYSAYKIGVKYFESSFGGLGGSPFSLNSSGNVCSEDMVHMFQSMGERKDINIAALISVAKEAEEFFGHKLPGILMHRR